MGSAVGAPPAAAGPGRASAEQILLEAQDPVLVVEEILKASISKPEERRKTSFGRRGIPIATALSLASSVSEPPPPGQMESTSPCGSEERQAGSQAGVADERARAEEEEKQRRMVLRGAIDKASQLTGSVYRGAKWFTPGFVRSRIDSVEGYVVARSQPFGNPLDNLLTVVDNEIDNQVLEPAEIRVKNTKERLQVFKETGKAVVGTALSMGKFLPGGTMLAGMFGNATRGPGSPSAA